MSTEAALLGVPTISAFQGVLYTELYLKSVGLLVKSKDQEKILQLAKRLLAAEVRVELSRKAKLTLGSMEDPVPKIVDKIAGA